jgi:ATP-dependent Clp protease, protease subunit
MIFQVQDNTIIAHGEIWNGNGMEFVSLFSQLEAKYSKIKVKLHSYGGSVFDGNLIYNTIQNSKKEVDLDIIGIAASMAAVISQSRKDKKPRMVRNGFLMIHAPSGSTYGGALDHENNAKLLRSIENTLVQVLSTSLSKPKNYVAKWMLGDNWFDAEEALKEGLISEIIEPESDTVTANLNPQELGAQAMYYQFTALLTPKNESQINLDHTMKKPIIEALALVGVNEQSSDTAVIEAVRQQIEAKTNGLQAKLDAEIKKNQALEAKFKEQGRVAIATEIEAARKAGKITQDQVATYEGIAEASGIDALKTVLGAIPVRQSIIGQMRVLGKTDSPVGRESWDFDKWQKEDPKGFEALQKDDPETFEAIVKAKYKK